MQKCKILRKYGNIIETNKANYLGKYFLLKFNISASQLLRKKLNTTIKLQFSQVDYIGGVLMHSTKLPRIGQCRSEGSPRPRRSWRQRIL